MSRALTNSIAPFIYPLFPAQAGVFHYLIDVERFFQYPFSRDFTGLLSMNIKTWKAGNLAGEDVVDVSVENGIPEHPRIVGERVGFQDSMAYLEMHITTDKPVFDRPLFENNLAVLVRDGFGAVMIIDMPKFADTRIIEQIREIGSYCMSHTGISIDREKGYGDFFLMINPYEQDLIVNLQSNHNGRLKVRVKSHDVAVADLSPLMGNDVWASVSLTAKQRVLLYDLKAPLADPFLPNSLDHLDPFRGEHSLQPGTWTSWTKHHLKQAARSAGITRL